VDHLDRNSSFDFNLAVRQSFTAEKIPVTLSLIQHHQGLHPTRLPGGIVSEADEILLPDETYQVSEQTPSLGANKMTSFSCIPILITPKNFSI
jgi:hypothetical protein